MPALKVWFPLPELNEFVNLDPSTEEIDSVYECLEYLQYYPYEGAPVPFDQYPEFENCRAHTCDRFIIVYAFDDKQLEVAAVLLESDYSN
jgi:hypothetical protein